MSLPGLQCINHIPSYVLYREKGNFLGNSNGKDLIYKMLDYHKDLETPDDILKGKLIIHCSCSNCGIQLDNDKFC